MLEMSWIIISVKIISVFKASAIPISEGSGNSHVNHVNIAETWSPGMTETLILYFLSMKI